MHENTSQEPRAKSHHLESSQNSQKPTATTPITFLQNRQPTTKQSTMQNNEVKATPDKCDPEPGLKNDEMLRRKERRRQRRSKDREATTGQEVKKPPVDGIGDRDQNANSISYEAKDAKQCKGRRQRRSDERKTSGQQPAVAISPLPRFASSCIPAASQADGDVEVWEDSEELPGASMINNGGKVQKLDRGKLSTMKNESSNSIDAFDQEMQSLPSVTLVEADLAPDIHHVVNEAVAQALQSRDKDAVRAVVVENDGKGDTCISKQVLRLIVFAVLILIGGFVFLGIQLSKNNNNEVNTGGCSNNELDNCDANASCKNVDGEFQCSCNTSYAGDGLTCIDINECAENIHSCNDNASCSNTDGGYDCDCNDGYFGDGVICSDIDECAEDTHTCDDNASCSNNEGDYDCDCNDGYDGDGFSCSDIDECATQGTVPTPCAPYGSCFNTNGGYRCDCNNGFSFDGVRCTPNDFITVSGGSTCNSGIDCAPTALSLFCESHVNELDRCCVGNIACGIGWNTNAMYTIYKGSCRGELACDTLGSRAANITVGEGSCVGSSACFALGQFVTGTLIVGANSCTFSDSCFVCSDGAIDFTIPPNIVECPADV